MLKEFFNKYRQGILYLFFGVVTTAVNFLVYYPVYNFCGLSATFSDIIAWIVSVLAAFFTNKPFVFQSKDWSLKTVIPEFWKFVLSRAGSGLLEILSIFLLTDVLLLNGNIVKIIVSVAVVILNYIFSRFLVFKK